MEKLENERIIRFPEISKMVGLSRSTIWRREASGDFPKRVRIGKNSVGWKFSDVQRWIASRPVKDIANG